MSAGRDKIVGSGLLESFYTVIEIICNSIIFINFVSNIQFVIFKMKVHLSKDGLLTKFLSWREDRNIETRSKFLVLY